MGREGYIKIYRKIWDNPIVTKDPDHLAIWIFLLTEAKYEQQKSLLGGKTVLLNPGQFTIGRQQISTTTKVNESKVQRVLKSFEIEHLIEQQTTSRNRLITIVNWREYQSSEQQNEQQVNNKRTTTEQQLNTPEEGKKERRKEGKNKYNIFRAPAREEVMAYCIERGNSVDVDAFMDFYESKGWMVGKNKMKDWRAAVRNWERSNASKSAKQNERRFDWIDRIEF